MNEYKFSDFGNRLKTLREQQGLKQGQFADMVGISRQSMSNYESGKHSPDVDVIVRMAHSLNCSTDYLMGLTEHSNSSKQIEFDESISKLAEILFSIPEPARIHWLDTFVGTAEWVGIDLNSNADFSSSAHFLLNALMSLTDCCFQAKEIQSQGNYTEQTAQKIRNKRFHLLSLLRNELNKLDNLSYQFTDIASENEDNSTLTELRNCFEEHFQNRKDV